MAAATASALVSQARAASSTSPLATKLLALPAEFFAALAEIDVDDVALQVQHVRFEQPAPGLPAHAPSCHMCSVPAFASVSEQRGHFKSDWHLLNLKLRARGKPAVASQEQAEQTLNRRDQEDAESLSASADSSGDVSSQDEEPAPSEDHFTSVDNTPLVTARTAYASVHLTLYAALARTREELQALSLSRRRPWAVLLYQAGHFAAAMYENGKCVAHKTEHRYVVRKKQGGAQSLQDEKSFKSRSAGAQLRRHGEMEMRLAVQGLLKSWNFAPCAYIFLAIPQRARGLFVNAEGGFDKRDGRLRRVPFDTRRPTLAETKRVYDRLCTVWLHPAPVPVSLPPRLPPPPAPAPAESVASPSPADLGKELPQFSAQPIHIAAQANDAAKIIELVTQDPEALAALDAQGRTALHVAAEEQGLDALAALLALGADPTSRDFALRLPVHVATADARTVLRRFCLEHPDRWDWRKAMVEPALTAEQEEARRAKERERRARKKEKAKDDKQREVVALASAAQSKSNNEPCCDLCGKVLSKYKSAWFCQGSERFCSAECMRTRRRDQANAALDKRLAAGGSKAD